MPLTWAIEYAVLTCGEETVSTCIGALQREGVSIRLIANKSPLHYAVSDAIYGSTADVVCQVDADVVLYPGAAAIIQSAVEGHLTCNKNQFALYFWLFDTFENRYIRWFKVYCVHCARHANLPIKNVRDCSEQYEKDMNMLGYYIRRLEDFPPIGDHIVKDPGVIFSRYAKKVAKRGFNSISENFLDQVIAGVESGAVNHTAAAVGMLFPRANPDEEISYSEELSNPIRRRIDSGESFDWLHSLAEQNIEKLRSIRNMMRYFK